MPRIAGYDMLRGWAAVVVVFFHLFQNFEGGQWLYQFFINGWKAVDLFFALSGALLYALWSNKEKYSLKATVVRRIERIYPPHILVMFAYLMVEGAQLLLGSYGLYTGAEGASASSFLTQFFLINMLTGDVGVWNVVTWSLSCEIILSLILAFVMCSRLHRFIVPLLFFISILLTILLKESDYYLLYRASASFFAGCLLVFVPRCSIPRIFLPVAFILVFFCDYLIDFGFLSWLAISLICVYLAGSKTINLDDKDSLFWSWSLVIGGLSYYIYLTHVFIIERYKNLAAFNVISLSDSSYISVLFSLFVYLFLVIISSQLLKWITNLYQGQYGFAFLYNPSAKNRV